MTQLARERSVEPFKVVDVLATVGGCQRRVGWISETHRHCVTSQVIFHKGCIVCCYVRQALSLHLYIVLKQVMIPILLVKCPSSPELCLFVFPPFPEYMEPLASALQEAEFSLVFSSVQYCLILVLRSFQNPVPENNWDVVPYLWWPELRFSCAAFHMRKNARWCPTLLPTLEDKVTYEGVCGCSGDGWDTGENSYTNFSSARPPKINIRCCMLREKGRGLSLILLFSRTNSTKYLCCISAGIQMSKILTAFFSAT